MIFCHESHHPECSFLNTYGVCISWYSWSHWPSWFGYIFLGSLLITIWPLTFLSGAIFGLVELLSEKVFLEYLQSQTIIESNSIFFINSIFFLTDPKCKTKIYIKTNNDETLYLLPFIGFVIEFIVREPGGATVIRKSDIRVSRLS